MQIIVALEKKVRLLCEGGEGLSIPLYGNRC